MNIFAAKHIFYEWCVSIMYIRISKSYKKIIQTKMNKTLNKYFKTGKNGK
jgi:hypothetical protein